MPSAKRSCDSSRPVAWLEDATKKVGVLSVEAQTIAVCEQRTDESKRLMIEAGFPADQIYQVPYGGDTSSGQEAAGPVITANPDVTDWLIFSCNDEGVLGAINALATAGADPASVMGVGIGAYEACKFWAADLPSGFTAALFISGLDVGRAARERAVGARRQRRGACRPRRSRKRRWSTRPVRIDPRPGVAGELACAGAGSARGPSGVPLATAVGAPVRRAPGGPIGT